MNVALLLFGVLLLCGLGGVLTWYFLREPVYKAHDFVQWTDTGTDIGDAIIGPLRLCQQSCNKAPGCLGFSRLKSAKADDHAECWLKKQIKSRELNTDYQTFMPEP